jgi:hypothetical protein
MLKAWFVGFLSRSMGAVVIANLIIAVGLCTGFLALLDIFISEKQREKLASVMISIWSALDDAKRASLFDLLRRRNLQLWSAAIVTLVISALPWIGEVGFRPNPWKSIPVCMISGVLALLILQFALRAKSPTLVFIRGLISIVCLQFALWCFIVFTARSAPMDATGNPVDPIRYMLEAIWTIYLFFHATCHFSFCCVSAAICRIVDARSFVHVGIRRPPHRRI